METTLLYILHWILLDAAEECAETDADSGNPFYYLFSIPTMSVRLLYYRFTYFVNGIFCEKNVSVTLYRLRIF